MIGTCYIRFTHDVEYELVLECINFQNCDLVISLPIYQCICSMCSSNGVHNKIVYETNSYARKLSFEYFNLLDENNYE